jgi:adenylate kinase
LTERPASPERGIDGQWVETTSEEIANRQIDDEHVGRSSQSFESVMKKEEMN